jgi:hypothetical protein
MKKTILTLTIFISSCGLNESDKSYINHSLSIHNISQHLNFTRDSIDEATNYTIIELLGVVPKKDWDKFVNEHMAVYKNEWNKPYQIEKDYNLTLDEYLSYCKTMGYDPKTYVNLLNK